MFWSITAQKTFLHQLRTKGDNTIKIRYFNFSHCFNIFYVQEVAQFKISISSLKLMYCFNHFKEVQLTYASLHKHL